MARKRKPVTEIARQAKWIAETLLPRTTSLTAAEIESLPYMAPIAERYSISPATLASGAAFYSRVRLETGESLDVDAETEE